MPYLIDGNWIIPYLTGLDEAIQLLESLSGEGIAISIISYIEVYQGVERDPDPRQAAQQLQAFLENAPILPVSLPVAQGCARLRESLRKQGKRVRTRALDLIVAATALEHDLTLVTKNRDDFNDIRGLKLYQPRARRRPR
jgi:predicted nucleic acid-binding protein